MVETVVAEEGNKKNFNGCISINMYVDTNTYLHVVQDYPQPNPENSQQSLCLHYTPVCLCQDGKWFGKNRRL